MTKLFSFIILSVVALAVIFPRIGAEAVIPDPKTKEFNRTLFPDGFMFGTATAAYQIEGAAHTNGKGPSIWDSFVKLPNRIKDNKTADVTDDFYHRYKEDIKLMKDIGMDSFRFSISWSRILPKGKLSGGINQEGVKFYNDVIDELLANGIKPFVTLFHFDTPQALEDEYKGFLSSKIVNDYRDFADLCFNFFGDRVKFWLTFNEPSTFMVYGYTLGQAAPGRCSKQLGCPEGDSGTEPYIAAHNILLSHATAVKLYREKYQATQKGQIGITLVTYDFIPNITNTLDDKEAAKRIQDFVLGWFLNTITYGDYPTVMRSLVADRLPKFTPAQSQMLRGSKDFLGFNYYSGRYAAKNTIPRIARIPTSYLNDSDVAASAFKNGKKDGEAIGEATGIDWIFEYPQGFEHVLMYIKDNYENPVIYITENGYPEKDDGTLSREKELKDSRRVNYFQQHLKYLLSAIKNGVNVKGYYAWSFTDNFEWNSGYIPRFGIVYVDYKDQLKRTLKASATWFQEFLLKKH